MKDFIYDNKFFTIHHDASYDWLYVDWKGHQVNSSLEEGCIIMLRALAHHRLHKVLNDNTNVKGLWNAEWIANEFAPKIIAAGLKQFAWILSADEVCADMARETFNRIKERSVIKFFNKREEGIEWLIYGQVDFDY